MELSVNYSYLIVLDEEKLVLTRIRRISLTALHLRGITWRKTTVRFFRIFISHYHHQPRFIRKLIKSLEIQSKHNFDCLKLLELLSFEIGDSSVFDI